MLSRLPRAQSVDRAYIKVVFALRKRNAKGLYVSLKFFVTEVEDGWNVNWIDAFVAAIAHKTVCKGKLGRTLCMQALACVLKSRKMLSSAAGGLKNKGKVDSLYATKKHTATTKKNSW